MKIRTFLLAAAAIAAVACQTPEEKVKAYDEAHNAMVEEFQVMMDSLSTDPEKQEAFYNDFIEKYKEFNLKAAKKNSDNEVAMKVLMNLYGLIEDEQVGEIISKMPQEYLENEQVAYIKKALDARKATAEGMMFTDFTVEHVYGYDRSMDPQPLKQEVKLSDQQYKDKGLQVLSLAVWERRPQSHTIETAAELGMDWLHINNCGQVPTDIYGVEGIPHLMLIGPDGTILKRGFHGLEGIQEAVAEFIKQ